MEWRNLFRQHILARGLDYYERNLIEKLEVGEEKVVGKVRGTKQYTVELGYQNSELRIVDCDCPHSADGNYCKHMAAVLYAYEGILEHRPQKEYSKPVEELVNVADEKTIREFLMETLSENNHLREQFEAMLD